MKNKNELIDRINERINEADIATIVKTAIGDIYAWATFERGFPDITDGMKTSIRRIIMAMIDSKCDSYSGKFIKCSSVVGNCLAKYHPHGDVALYQTLIGLGQSFDLNYPLIEPGGNFGNHKGEAYAAMRYTECKASQFAEDVIFRDFNRNIMDFKQAEIPDNEEPVWFSTRIPLVLLNSSTGIGEAFVCNIPPHNITDVVNMCVKFINNPNISESDLIDEVYPDYPCGGFITNADEVKQLYLNKEKGTIKLKADIELDHENNIIIIKEFPYGSNCNKLKKELFALADKSYHITKINTIIDKISSRYPELNEAYIYCNKDANLNEIYKILMNKTSLKGSQNISFRLYDSGKVVLLSVKDIINYWYKARREYLRREFSYKKGELEVKLHILEGLLIIYDKIDEITKAIKQADGKEDAINIINEIVPELSKIQAKAIAELQLYKISKRSKEDLLSEIASLKEKIKEYEYNLSIIKEIIIDQLYQLENKYKKPRRTRICNSESETEIIDINNKVLTYTRFSYKFNDFDSFLNTKNISNGLSNYKFNNYTNKDIIDYTIIDNDCMGLIFFYGDGTYQFINEFDSLNYWTINQNILNKTYISKIIPVYNDDDYLLILSDTKKLRLVKSGEFKNKAGIGLISNALYIDKNSLNSMILIIDEDSNYLYFNLSDENIPITNKKASGVLTNFEENKETFMVNLGGTSKNLILFYTSPESNYMNIISDDVLIVNSRSNKLKNLKSKHLNEIKLTGISIVYQNSKNSEYDSIIIGKNNTLKMNARNLKFFNEYRKISLNSIGLVQFKI